MNWRRSEWISATTLIVVFGWIWIVSAKNSLLLQNTLDLNVIKPRVDMLQEKQDTMEARNQAQMTYIIRELDSINKKVGRD
jgi:hypothetical protein